MFIRQSYTTLTVLVMTYNKQIYVCMLLSWAVPMAAGEGVTESGCVWKLRPSGFSTAVCELTWILPEPARHVACLLLRSTRRLTGVCSRAQQSCGILRSLVLRFESRWQVRSQSSCGKRVRLVMSLRPPVLVEQLDSLGTDLAENWY
jgi:hypothetical protein